MSKQGKLRNIDALQRMLAGEHRTQTKTTIGFSDIKPRVHREVGDVWEETGPMGNTKIIEQREGFKIVRGALAEVYDNVRAYLTEFQNCPKDRCTCTDPGTADKKLRAKMGMCLECVSEAETRLMIRGEFEEYAKGKMYANAVSFFKRADQELEAVVDELSKKSSYVNENGSEEVWESTNRGAVVDRIRIEYDKFKSSILNSYKDNPDELE